MEKGRIKAINAKKKQADIISNVAQNKLTAERRKMSKSMRF